MAHNIEIKARVESVEAMSTKASALADEDLEQGCE
jgi:hypothetical protein